MSNHDDAQNAVIAYSELLRRALRIPGNAPYWHYLSDDNKAWARIAIDGKSTTLYWPDAGVEWDSPTIDTDSFSFPTSLLFLTDEELDAWKSEQRAIYDAEQEEKLRLKQEADAKEREKADRLAYERLKRRFAPTNA